MCSSNNKEINIHVFVLKANALCEVSPQFVLYKWSRRVSHHVYNYCCNYDGNHLWISNNHLPHWSRYLFFFSTWNQKWNAEVESVNRPLLEFLTLSIRIECCNLKRAAADKDTHVPHKPRNMAEKIDRPGICSFDFSSAWIRIPLYDHSDNHHKMFARVKAKRSLCNFFYGTYSRNRSRQEKKWKCWLRRA